MRILKKRGNALYFSKRDAKAYFDLLRLTPVLRPYFGRTPLRAGALADAMRIPVSDLKPFIEDFGIRFPTADDLITPTCTSCPMGFSWSSYVAQEEMLAICSTSGLREDQLLSLDSSHPRVQTELATVATDDVIFIHTDADLGSYRLNKFDQAMREHGVERNVAKDIDLASEVVALGCVLSNDPPWVEPNSYLASQLLLDSCRLQP